MWMKTPFFVILIISIIATPSFTQAKDEDHILRDRAPFYQDFTNDAGGRPGSGGGGSFGGGGGGGGGGSSGGRPGR
ncbi:glycine-rich protein 5-like [Actinia tenebrosa]|uniref:Glycine-rich protein 5-like n=1 Tax=Actinia tenebrosa TaxID=6105 RepID=A0A6P8I6S0_ACTTE|nr:glycine-rich protein 5-like [Actinia tenebrosa]